MNEKAKLLFKNLNYTIVANLLILVVSIALNLIVPKFLGVTEYSYWQLYVFYASYVGFFQLGWIDGIYLKIGGEHYDNLDKSSLKAQILYLFLFTSGLALLLVSCSLIFVTDVDRKIILIFTGITIIIVNIKGLISYILQSTNRIREYAQLSRDDRYLYLIGVLIYLAFGGRNFHILILIDIFSRILITLKGLYFIKDIIKVKKDPFSVVYGEIIDNISIGLNLMIGNIASMLILGVSRLFVENKWSIEVFGKLSFALSISSMFMVFINSISVVLYPLLRRTNEKTLPDLYVYLRNIFVPLTFGVLLFFYPAKILLDWWLPEYQESMLFMGILFPMIVYEGRVALLVNTYLKTIRQEKILLYSNAISLIFTIIVTSFSVFLIENLVLTVIMIMLSLVFRCVLSEYLLLRKMEVEIGSAHIQELVLTISFILLNLLATSSHSFILYFIIFSVYLFLNRNKITRSFKYLLLLSKEK